MNRAVWYLGSLLALGILGCGGGGTDDGAVTETEEHASSAATPGKKAKAAQGPAEAVTEFMTAIRAGDDVKASQMFTKLARENGQGVSPPASDTAKFDVGEVEMLPDNVAHVAASWIDEGETYKVVWALRKEEEGWRIAGMATKLSEDDEFPVLLNFEDPEDMRRQQQLAEEELMRRAQENATQENATQKAAKQEGVTQEARELDISDNPLRK